MDDSSQLSNKAMNETTELSQQSLHGEEQEAKQTFFQLVRKFQNLGCKNHAKCSYSCRIYVDLKDGIKNLEKFYDPDFDIIFLRGDNEDGCNIYVPSSSSEKIDLKRIELIQEKLCDDGKINLTLCICDPSSTILYYRFKKGWKE